MAGPFWSLLRSLGVGAHVFVVLYVLVGFAVVRSVALSLLAFLALGGWAALRSVLHIVYRDFRFIKAVAVIPKALANFETSKKNNIADVFSERVSSHPDKPAILFEDQCWTFRQLECFANQVGHFFLEEQGLKKGDTVAMFMENCPEFVGTWLGLSKIGVKAAFINCNLREAALLHCLNVCQPKAIVYTASLGEGLKAVCSDLDETLQKNCFSLEGEDNCLPASSNLEIKMKSKSIDAPPGDSDDTLFFIYTSGTTGLPKAVPISKGRFFSAGMGFARLLGCNSQDIIYCTLPFYHSSASVIATGMFFHTGATLVMRRKFSASQFWNDCVKHKCTIVVYIGEICRYLLAQPDGPSDTKHCIRIAIGNGLRAQIWEKFQNRFNIPMIREFYAATEGNASGMNITDKVGSCGFMLMIGDNKKILKIDPETGELVRDSNGRYIKAEINEPGEVVGRITKDSPFPGYTNQVATRKKILQDVFTKGDSYFRSGDLMRMDEEGYLYFCDRIGDTFRWKGENVSTTEVEGAIVGILGVRDVVVFGVGVPGTEGKAGMACIVGDEESVDVKGLAEKVFNCLPSYAVPRFVRLIQQADLTGTFKFQKTRLRTEGYDKEKTTDPVFILDKRSYVPLDGDKYLQLQNGEIHL